MSAGRFYSTTILEDLTKNIMFATFVLMAAVQINSDAEKLQELNTEVNNVLLIHVMLLPW